MDDRHFRRSKKVEDRRKEKLELGPFGTLGLPPNVFEGGGTMEGLNLSDLPPVQRTRLGNALGLNDLEGQMLKQEQNAQVRDALDGAPVAVPGQDDPNGPPVRIDRRPGKADGGAFANPVPLMSRGQDTAATQQAIIAAAREAGLDPSEALAYAERESSFNPSARNSKTIEGLYQMRGDHRARYGWTPDVKGQVTSWGRFIGDVKKEMAGSLGRDPTAAEGYLGHHFGGVRAGRMMKMDPSTPVDAVFTRREMAENPHFARAGTVGQLNSSIIADMQKRQAKFGGQLPEAGLIDFAKFGEPVMASLEQPLTGPDPNMVLEDRKFSAPDFAPSSDPAENLNTKPAPAAPSAPDFSTFGVPA